MRNHVDLPMLLALQAEWRQHPPVHHLVAAYLSYEPPLATDATDSPKREETMQQLMSMMPTTTAGPKLDTGPWDSFAQSSNSKEPTHG